MTHLPIDDLLDDIIALLRRTRRLVLVAPPGAGKTTRVPPAILAAHLLPKDHPRLVMLQPRRVAARAVAQRIADENAWQVGNEVGYHIRFEKKLRADTRLCVLTEGILTRRLVDDAYLDGVGCVVLDEFHERSLHSDLALALLKEIQSTVRPDLSIVVMSATLDAQRVAAYLDDAPVVRSEGRAFPVRVSFSSHTDSARPLVDRVVQALDEVLLPPAPRPSALQAGDDGGDILVFLPGAEEIRRAARRLEGMRDLLVLPLHGSMTADEQMRALAPADKRKVILATNIAETSLTIDGVTTVIDSGLARVASYDPRRGLDRLELTRISRASATQRAGRAGRTAPGRCLRLWTQAQDNHLAEFETPEVRRIDLAGTVLMLHAWGLRDLRGFAWFEAPEEAALTAAEQLLLMLGALSAEDAPQDSPAKSFTITKLGRRMLALPAHPRLARLLIAAAGQNLLREGAAMAALLSEKDILAAPLVLDGKPAAPVRQAATQGKSDLLWRMDLLAEAEAANFAPWLRDKNIDPHAARQAARARDDLLRATKSLQSDPRRASPSSAEQREEFLLKLPLYAYPDRVVRRRSQDAAAGVAVGGSGVRLAPESIVRQCEFFIALDARKPAGKARAPFGGVAGAGFTSGSETQVRIASAIEPAWLAELFPHDIQRRASVTYDADRDRIAPLEQVFYRDLLLEEDRHGSLDPAQAAAALGTAAAERAEEIFQSNPAATTLLARVRLLRRALPEHPWPPLDHDQLAELLQSIVPGRRSLAALREADLAGLLRSTLPYPLDRMLDTETPESIAVPSGSHIKIDYTADPPVLAVRLQELFGWTQTPRVAGGRIPLLLHLLSPGFRPVQITDDLASFWRSAYFDVRKDLRIRYPRHAWPEDPLTAAPQAKGRRRE